jgi:hypothetical protein
MVLCAGLLIHPGLVLAEDSSTYATRNLTVETALKAAQEALKKCRAAAGRLRWRWSTAAV